MVTTCVNKVKDTLTDTKTPVIIDERIVTLDDDDVLANVGGGKQIRLDFDSYVVCFTGRRGGGKTTMLTFYSVLTWRQLRLPIVSNFHIEFIMRRFRPDGKSYLEHVVSQPFDFERLILDTDAYKNCLIVLDEAPDLISHMAASSQKNKLVDAWSRQIRKNKNSLFMGAQSIDWIDKSMRWQVDVEIECKDVARALDDNSGLPRGALIEVTYYDNSGQWSDETTFELRARHEIPWTAQYEVCPGVLFGDNKHFPVFDSWRTVDILESLRKVEVKMSKISLGDKANSSGPVLDVDRSVLLNALEYIGYAMQNDTPHSAHFQKQFYKGINAGERDKNNLGKILSRFNVERGVDTANHRWFAFQAFDFAGFKNYVEFVIGA